MRFVNRFLVICSFMIGISSLAAAQDMPKGEMKKDEMKNEMAMEDTRPIVAIIRADWCPYCKKLDPMMEGLMVDYAKTLRFVVFDISNKETTAASVKLAKEKGLEEFFEENKGKSAFVAILKDGKNVFNAKYKTDKEFFVAEFDKAIK
jgi:thiol-disulfide isomerase/thioredoxin